MIVMRVEKFKKKLVSFQDWCEDFNKKCVEPIP